VLAATVLGHSRYVPRVKTSEVPFVHGTSSFKHWSHAIRGAQLVQTICRLFLLGFSDLDNKMRDIKESTGYGEDNEGYGDEHE
jgi:hypothetical protein